MVSEKKQRPHTSLRPVHENDSARIWEWRNLPHVSKFMYTTARIEWNSHQDWFKKMMLDPACLYWIIVVDEVDIGVACLTQINNVHGSASWAFYIADESFRGTGVGNVVELLVCINAFEMLGLRRVWCEVLAWNKPIIRMHEKFGFVREGVKRQHVVSVGKPCDVVYFGLLRNEWIEVKNRSLGRLRRAGFQLTEIEVEVEA